MTLAKTWDGQPHPTIFRQPMAGIAAARFAANWHVPDPPPTFAEHDLPMLRTYHREG